MEPLLCFVFPDNKQILACFVNDPPKKICFFFLMFINCSGGQKKNVKWYKYLLDLVSNECNVFIINT